MPIRFVIACNSLQHGKMTDENYYFSYREISLASAHSCTTLHVRPNAIPWSNKPVMRTLRFQLSKMKLSIFPDNCQYILQKDVINVIKTLILNDDEFDPSRDYIAYKGSNELKRLIEEEMGFLAFEVTGPKIKTSGPNVVSCSYHTHFPSSLHVTSDIHCSLTKVKIICQLIGLWDTI
jgi:hypothetical protein